MIYCPICGTNNRHGSKFCNECGTKLGDPSQVRCPVCGEMNPAGTAACEACGAKLAAPVFPIPVGTGVASWDEDEIAGVSAGATQLPLWFQSLPEEMRESAETGETVEGVAVAAVAPVLGDGVAIGEEADIAPPAPEVEDAFGLGAETTSPVPDEEGQLPEEELERVALVSEGEGPEKGIEAALLAASTLSQPRAAISTPLGQGEEGSQHAEPMIAQAQLFAEIVALPPEVVLEEAVQPRAPWLNSLPRWIFFVLLIVAVTAPLLVKRPLLSLAREWFLPGWSVGAGSLEVSPAVAALYDQIAALESNAPVLVAVDYDPTTMGEMDPLARAVLQHLMEAQSRVVTVSLLPAGAGTAQELLDVVGGRSGGLRHANLGYLAGQAAGVRLLGQSIPLALPTDFFGNQVSGLDVMDGLTTLRDFDLIIELAASPDTLRWWVEQGSTPQRVPMVAGVSAAVEPLVRPYYETEPRQVGGLAGGIRGAAMYGALLANGPQGGDQQQDAGDSEAKRMEAQMAGQLVLILAIVAGAVFYLVRLIAEWVRR